MPASERIARLLVVPLAILFGFLLLRDSGGSGGDPVTTSDEGAAAPATTSTADGETTTTEAPATTTTAAPSTTAAPATTTSTAARGLALPPADRGAAPAEPVGSYQDGAVVLRGSVPDVATAERYLRRLTAVLGAGNVTSELTEDDRVAGSTLRIEVARDFRSPEDGTYDPGFASLAGVGTDVLEGVPEARLVITGHTDSVGTEATTLALSVARARLVVDHLVEQGVPGDRLAAAGAGQSQPVASNDTPEGRAANRRITAAFEGITPDRG